MKKRIICVVLTDRANYGRLWPVMKEIEKHDDLQLQTICAGSMLLDRFGKASNVVEADGFKIDGKVFMEIEGSIPLTMSKSIGFGLCEFSSEFARLSPDMVLLIGDRYEALAACIAATFMNIPVAHIQGGEVSGSIDESTRHVITKLAHFHFPATKRAGDYVVRMGEDPSKVFCYGCPCGDYIIPLSPELPRGIFDVGVGAHIEANEPFFLVMFHPVTTAIDNIESELLNLLAALDRLEHKTVWLWPNIDAGSDKVSRILRQHREKRGDKWMRLIKNFDPLAFQKILKSTKCAIGNSSSFVRDSTFSGTPVVLVGDRQKGREHANNLMPVAANAEAIYEAILKQLAHGRYQPSNLYGSGNTAAKIAKTLSTVELYVQKKLHYIYE